MKEYPWTEENPAGPPSFMSETLNATLNISLNVPWVRGAILDETSVSVRWSPCNLFLPERFRWRRMEPLSWLYAKYGCARKCYLCWKDRGLQKQADWETLPLAVPNLTCTDSSYAQHLGSSPLIRVGKSGAMCFKLWSAHRSADGDLPCDIYLQGSSTQALKVKPVKSHTDEEMWLGVVDSIDDNVCPSNS